MKKFLLFTIAAMMIGGAYAQFRAPHVKVSRQKVTTSRPMTVAPTKLAANVSELKTIATKTSKPSRNMRSIKGVGGPLNGLWYTKPAGTFAAGVAGNVAYNFVPPFTDLTWTNQYTGESEVTWFLGNGNTIDANEEGNFVDNFGLGGYYMPRITNEVDTFYNGLASGITSATGALVWVPDSIETMCANDLTGGHYYGGMGTDHDVDVDSTDKDNPIERAISCRNLYNYYDQPAVPLYLESISFRSYTESQTGLPLAKKTEMTLTIFADDEDETVLFETPFSLNEFTADEGDGSEGFGTFNVPVYQEDENGLFAELVIDQPFGVRISGFDQEGADFLINVCSVSLTGAAGYDNYLAGGMYPTLLDYYYDDNGEQYGTMWWFNSKTGAQYNGVLFLNGFFDVAMVDPDYAEMTAPTEGGNIYIEYEEEAKNEETGEVEVTTQKDETVLIYATLPAVDEDENENYVFEHPEWLELTGFTDQYHANYDVNLYQFEAQALPEGETYREAEVVVKSNKGANTTFKVVQGEKPEPQPEYPEGDLNKDTKVNVGDVAFLYSALLAGKSDPELDLNQDGSVNAGDVGYLYKLILGSASSSQE